MRSQGKGPEPKSSSTTAALPEAMVIDHERIRAIRSCLHDLANVFTGMMIATGLLAQRMEDEELRHYAVDIGESGERGSALVRAIREQLLGGTEAVRLSAKLQQSERSEEI